MTAHPGVLQLLGYLEGLKCLSVLSKSVALAKKKGGGEEVRLG